MSNEIENGISVGVLRTALKNYKEPLASESSKETFSGTDLLNLNIEEIPKLWHPFFPMRGVVGLTGSSDCGKSLLLRQLAIAIALGKNEFLGCPLHTRHRRALYVCTEDDKEGIAALLHKQSGSVKAKELSNIIFAFEYTNLLKRLEELLSNHEFDLIVIDVWSDTFNGNPNNWVEVRQNLSGIKDLADRYNCLIAVIHHTVKNSEKSAPDKSKLNGSQAIEAKLRCLLEMRQSDNPDERILYVLKNNYMSNEDKLNGLVLELHKERLLFTNTGRIASKHGTVSEGKKYDKQLWITRMVECREQTGFSFDKARYRLSEQFPGEDIPGLTWFKTNCKDLDGQSSTWDNL
jgi:hypothetical protein